MAAYLAASLPQTRASGRSAQSNRTCSDARASRARLERSDDGTPRFYSMAAIDIVHTTGTEAQRLALLLRSRRDEWNVFLMTPSSCFEARLSSSFFLRTTTRGSKHPYVRHLLLLRNPTMKIADDTTEKQGISITKSACIVS